MARVSLQTVEQIQLLRQRFQSPTPASSYLARLAPGDIIKAEVLQSLGNGLFSLGLGGFEITASSTAPLTIGQRLTLQVNSNDNGQPALHVLTLTDDKVAGVASKPNVTGFDHTGVSEALARSAAQGATPSRSTRQESIVSPNRTPEVATTASRGEPAVLVELRSLATVFALSDTPEPERSLGRLENLVKPDGPVARLLAARPDLAPQLELLLREIQERPGSLGGGIDELATQLSRLVEGGGAAKQGPLANAPVRLLSQLFGSTDLEQPAQLAQQLSERLGSLARGLEANLARTVAAAEPKLANAIAPVVSGPPTDPAPANATLLAPTDALRAPLPPPSTDNEEVAPRPTPSPAFAAPAVESNRIPLPDGSKAGSFGASFSAADPGQGPASAAPSAGQLVRGTFEGDLKGQLLELRSQLGALAADRPDASASAAQAVARVDALLNQITAQQVRNVEGLNQYFYAELPLDPRTGIREARLQVFYREQSASARPANSDRFTVALFLNLSRLGDVLAVVSQVDQAVTVGFTVEDPRVMELLDNESAALREILVRSGHAGATVTVRQPAPAAEKASAARAADPLWESFLDARPLEGDPGGRLDREA